MSKKENKKAELVANCDQLAVEPITNCDRLETFEVANCDLKPIIVNPIEDCIFQIRDTYVMADRDLAFLYGVDTKVLNQAVKRNIERFPKDFMFQLTEEEAHSLRSQIVTLKNKGGRGQHSKYLPYVFTEQGVAMLSGVLKSPIAVEVNIQIMRAFVAARRFFMANAQVFQKLETLEYHQLRLQEHIEEHDKQISVVLQRLEEKDQKPIQGIFYDGQMYDAHSFICNLIQRAKKRIVIIDNYLDNSVLTRLIYRQVGVPVDIYTMQVSKQFQLDVNVHNEQYPTVNVHITHKAHDRFLIIDDMLYHLGASIKDLGKKIVGFNLMATNPEELLSRL